MINLLLTPLFLFSGPTKPDQPFEFYQKKILEARSKINYLHMTIEATLEQKDQAPLHDKTEHWYNGIENRIRCDTIRNQGQFADKRQIACFNSLEGPGKTFVAQDPVDKRGFFTDQFRLNAKDKRALGYSASIYCDRLSPLDKIFLHQVNPAKISMSYVTLEGRQFLEMNLENKGGTVFKIVVDPEKDYNIISLSAELTYKNGSKLSISSESTLSKVNSIWFPSKLVQVEKIDGKMNRSETVNIKVHSINTPLANQIFSVNGMKLSEGKIIEMQLKPFAMAIIEGGNWKQMTRSQLRDYLDKHQTTFADVTPPEPAEPTEPGSRINYYWLAATIALSILAVLTAIYMYRKYRTS